MLKFPCACIIIMWDFGCMLISPPEFNFAPQKRKGRGGKSKKCSLLWSKRIPELFGVSGKIILRWALHNMSICGIWWDMNRVATITRMPFNSVEVPTLFIAMISGPSVAYCVLSECLMCHVSNFDWFRLTHVLDDLTSDCLLTYHTKNWALLTNVSLHNY